MNFSDWLEINSGQKVDLCSQGDIILNFVFTLGQNVRESDALSIFVVWIWCI